MHATFHIIILIFILLFIYCLPIILVNKDDHFLVSNRTVL